MYVCIVCMCVRNSTPPADPPNPTFSYYDIDMYGDRKYTRASKTSSKQGTTHTQQNEASAHIKQCVWKHETYFILREVNTQNYKEIVQQQNNL